jgi:hypothetical protein
MNCKFCKETIYLEIAEDCPQEWVDKLLPFAACNRCGDFFRARTTLTEKMQSVAIKLGQRTMTPEKAMGILTSLTRAFANAFAKFHRSKNILVDESIARRIIERPEKLSEILRAAKQQWKEVLL